MKRVKLFSFVHILLTTGVLAQPTIEWQTTLGGDNSDNANAIQQTSDGGFIIAGFTLSSNSGDVLDVHGGGDVWVVKLDSIGEIQWQKALGGSSTEVAEAIQQTTDGGYILAGRTFSNDGDVSGNHGGLDCWIVKLNNIGNIEWQKTLGGSGTDEAYSIQETSDGKFIMTGFSVSNDGDVSGNHGYFDVWLVNLDSSGTILWQKSLGGGSGADKAYCVRKTSDGGYIVAGGTNSNNGDVSGNHGDEDYWVIKLTNSGIIQWQKTLGGTGGEAAHSITETNDHGYIVVGEMGSGNTGDISGAHGGLDSWVVKLSENGTIQWQKPLGGSDQDYGSSIIQTSSGEFIVTGTTHSTDGDVQDNNGIQDYWIVKLNNLGGIQWQKTFGGTNVEWASAMQQTNDGGFILAGYTYSNDGDVTGNHGGQDIWVVKLHDSSVGMQDLFTAQSNHLNISPNPAQEFIRITMPNEENAVIVTISDLLGQQIARNTIQNGESIDVSLLPNGLYMVTATTPSGGFFSGRLQKIE